MYECSHDTYTWYFRLSPFRQPLWIWNAPGIGFSPLGQLGVPVEGAVAAVPRQTAGARLGTVHWGGAGGSGYMLTLGAKLGEASTVVGMDEVFFFSKCIVLFWVAYLQSQCMSFACWEGGCVVDETKNLVIFAPFFLFASTRRAIPP